MIEDFGVFIVSDNYKKELLNMDENQINAISERIADSLRDTQAKIRSEFEKDQSK